MSRPTVVIACMVAPPNRGGLNSTHFRGTHVLVEEPSTASEATRRLSASLSLRYSFVQNHFENDISSRLKTPGRVQSCQINRLARQMPARCNIGIAPTRESGPTNTKLLIGCWLIQRE